VFPPDCSDATSASTWLRTHWWPNASSIAAWPFAVLPVLDLINQLSAPCLRSRDRFCHVGDLQHRLVRAFAPAFAVAAEPLRLRPRPAAIRQAESRGMPLAYADVLDEAEDLGVPGHGGSDVGHDEYWGHSRVRCRAVREHPIRVVRERDALSVAIADPARRKGVRLASERRTG
jgi:hypothetical protein